MGLNLSDPIRMASVASGPVIAGNVPAAAPLPLLNLIGNRRLDPEMMDQPGLDPQEHRRALAGLRCLNAISRTADVLWRAVAPLATATGRTLRVLDAACGGGDVAVRLARLARAQGTPLAITAVDRSCTALEIARSHAADCGAESVEFVAGDVLRAPLPGRFDVVYSTLFLHHLSPPQAVGFLFHLAAAAEQLLLVDDLRRTRRGYWLAWTAAHLFSRSKIVHHDGPQSVEAAFLPDEALLLATAAGLHGATVHCHWPQRYLLTWRRP